MHKEVTKESYLYEEVADQVTRLIDQRALLPKDRVPSLRKLSSKIGVSVSTVLQAFMVLEMKGLIEARPRSGFYVKTARRIPDEPRVSNPAPVVTRVGVSELVAKVFQAGRDPEMVPLGLTTPDPDLLPIKRLNAFMSKAARDSGRYGICYDFPPGCERLRHEIAKRSWELGCVLSENEIITTNGAMEALNLCIRAVANPGDVIAVESPTFYGTLQVLESLGIKTIEIPTDPRNGIIIDSLESILRKNKIKACLLTPNFSNPLGSYMPDKNKKQLAELAAEWHIPIIEDDIYGDLYFGPSRPKTVKAFDKEGLVLLCSSFSKTIAPGYRVGFTAPGRFRLHVESMKFMNSMATASLPQLAIAAFLASGGYDRHLRTIRKAFATQVTLASNVIRDSFPKGTRLTRPQGGFCLWVELPTSISSLDLHRKAIQAKINIAPGPIFSASRKYQNFIRISCGYKWSPRIERGLIALGEIASKLLH